MRKSTENKRKNPRQKRAVDTIDVIMEATTQVLERNENASFTTNHIARRAGVSIGTLYRYFPHKKAILRQMAESEIRRREAGMREALANVDSDTGEEIIEAVVRSVLEQFRNHGRVRKRMLLSLIQDTELIAQANAVHIGITRLLLNRLVEIDPVRYRQPTDLLCATASSALLGSIRSMLFSEPAYLRDRDYERELIAMLTHFVTEHETVSPAG